MVKQGILNDYDLQANLEGSAKGQTCIICGINPVGYQWSDYSGEGMCIRCGCPYQLKWGSDDQKKEGKYPYLNLDERWIPIVKEYWTLTHLFVCQGIMLGSKPGLKEFNEWVDKNHPEMVKEIE